MRFAHLLAKYMNMNVNMNMNMNMNKNMAFKDPWKEEKRKPKTTWLGDIIQWIDIDLERILRVMDDRGQWRRMIHGVVNPRFEDN